MTPNNRPSIVRETATDGEPVVRVALDPRGSRWATLDAADYDALPAKLRAVPWFINCSGAGYEYVKAANSQSSADLVLIHRVILGARPGQAVHFGSQDHCNLRRRNLYVKKDGRAKRDHLGEVLRLPEAA